MCVDCVGGRGWLWRDGAVPVRPRLLCPRRHVLQTGGEKALPVLMWALIKDVLTW